MGCDTFDYNSDYGSNNGSFGSEEMADIKKKTCFRVALDRYA
jgi:hypothetical protein